MTKINIFNAKGREAELIFPSMCFEQFWACANPIPQDIYPFDFIVQGINGSTTFKKVQVKQIYTSKGKDKKVSVTGHNNRAYTKDAFDYLAVYDPYTYDWYVIPWSTIFAMNYKTTIRFGNNNKWQKYKLQKKNKS